MFDGAYMRMHLYLRPRVLALVSALSLRIFTRINANVVSCVHLRVCLAQV